MQPCRAITSWTAFLVLGFALLAACTDEQARHLGDPNLAEPGASQEDPRPTTDPTPNPWCERHDECPAGTFCAVAEKILTDEEIAGLAESSGYPAGSGICWLVPMESTLCASDEDCPASSVCAPGAELYYGAAWDEIVELGYPADGGQCVPLVEPDELDAQTKACLDAGLAACTSTPGCWPQDRCATIYPGEEDPGWPAECPGFGFQACLPGAAPPSSAQCEVDADCWDRALCVDGWCEPDPAYACADDGDCGDGEACYLQMQVHCSRVDDVFEESDGTITSTYEIVGDCHDLTWAHQCAVAWESDPDEPVQQGLRCHEDQECIAQGGMACIRWSEVPLTPEQQATLEENGADPDGGFCI